MAINKKNSPLWVKAVIIVIAVSFVASIALAGFQGFGGSTSSPTGSKGATPGTLTATYQPQVDSALAASKADPGNAVLLGYVGNVYYDWAVEEYQGGAIEASGPHWKAAVSYYDQALAITPGVPALLGDRAFALAYASSPDAKAALESFIATNDPALADKITSAKGLLAEIVASENSAPGSAPASTTP